MGDTKYLTPEMVQQLIDDMKDLSLKKLSLDQAQLLIETLCSGALRISEVLDFEPSDIMPNGKLRIRHAKTGWQNCDCSVWKYRPTKLISSDKNCQRCQGIGKYRIDQYGWVPDHILFRLQDLASKTEPGKKLFPISQRQVLRYVDKLASAGTHTFRHSWLTWMLETDKVNIRDIKQKARHTTLAVTDRYIADNTDLTRKKEADIMKDFI